MVASLDDNETQLINEINTRKEDYETDQKMLIADYEKKILKADNAYTALDKEMSDINDTFNK